jgi:hypothetical protein
MRALKLVLATALAVFGMAHSAHAIFVTAVPGPSSISAGAPGQSLIADFDGYLAPGYTITGGEIAIGDTYGCPNQCAANPAGDDTQYLNVRPGIYSLATLSSPAPLESFSLYWGSIDTYNWISFYSGATLIQSFSGAQIDSLTGATANGSQSDYSGNQRINFVFDGLLPNLIQLTSTQIAFESDNFFASALLPVSIAAVPEPAPWALLLVAFGALGFGVRRRLRRSEENPARLPPLVQV